MSVSHRGSHKVNSQPAAVGRRAVLVGLTGAVLALLGGCQRPPEEHPLRPADLFPYSGREARVTAASFPSFVTAEGPGRLPVRPRAARTCSAVLPCYCGCGLNAGHKSNLDCFVAGSRQGRRRRLRRARELLPDLPRHRPRRAETSRRGEVAARDPSRTSTSATARRGRAPTRRSLRPAPGRRAADVIRRRSATIGLPAAPSRCSASSRPWPSLAPTPASRLGSATTVHLEARQFAYGPGVVRVPRGSHVHLELASHDVTHGLYLEEYGVSLQAMPGQAGGGRLRRRPPRALPLLLQHDLRPAPPLHGRRARRRAELAALPRAGAPAPRRRDWPCLGLALGTEPSPAGELTAWRPLRRLLRSRTLQQGVIALLLAGLTLAALAGILGSPGRLPQLRDHLRLDRLVGPPQVRAHPLRRPGLVRRLPAPGARASGFSVGRSSPGARSRPSGSAGPGRGACAAAGSPTATLLAIGVASAPILTRPGAHRLVPRRRWPCSPSPSPWSSGAGPSAGTSARSAASSGSTRWRRQSPCG